MGLNGVTKDDSDPLDGQIPSMEDIFRAASALHNADVHVLKYMATHEGTALMKVVEESLPAHPTPLMDRVNEVLKQRETAGEKGGELLL
jgi:hypothetical protein